MRRLIRELSFTLAVVGGALTIWLVVVGGFDTTLFGVALTSNEPMRPFLLATISLAVFIWSGPGPEQAWRWVQQTTAAFDDRLVAGLLAAAVAIAGLVYGSFVAVGADAYGYVSQADLWLAGNLRIDQPWVADAPWPNAKWTAAPLGYRPIEHVESQAMVPTYSPGLPMLMAIAKGFFGHAALFWIVPLSGAVLVLATFGIGRELGSSRVGLAAAWLVAASPIVMFLVMPAMSDLPAAAAWVSAFYFSLRPGLAGAVSAGLTTAVAILIRPNLAPLAAIMLVWIATRTARDSALGARFDWRTALAYVAAAAPGALGLTWLYARLYGSPFTSGYGDLGDAFQWSHVLPNLRRYAGWFVESQTMIAVLGVAALIVPVRRLWPWVADRRAVLAMTAMSLFVVVQYLFYYVYDAWWFLRFLLPCWPFVMLGVAGMLIGGPARRGVWSLAALWIVVALGLYTLRTSTKLGTFEIWQGERAVVDIARAVNDATPERSLVLSVVHSGTLRYYGGRVTLRFDSLPEDGLDRAVDWLRDRGIGAYALLEPDEVTQFTRRFAGARAVAQFDGSAVTIYRGARMATLYDLAHAGHVASQAPMQTLESLRAAPPVPLPPLSLK
jgi:hypothetical protein